MVAHTEGKLKGYNHSQNCLHSKQIAYNHFLVTVILSQIQSEALDVLVIYTMEYIHCSFLFLSQLLRSKQAPIVNTCLPIFDF